jgi:hypothetical protein
MTLAWRRRSAFAPLLALVGFGASPVRLAAQSPEWTTILNVRPDPTPYIADWENDPLIVTLVLSYTGSGNAAFHLQGSILRGATPIVSGRSAAFEFVRPSQLILTTRDGIWERNSVDYQSSLRDQLERTGRIPDGEYQFCVDVRQGLPEAGGGALLSRDCAPFSITAPQPPSLVAPSDADSVRVGWPVFIWSPVMLGLNSRVSYHLRVAPVLPGQGALDALNNVPQHEADLAGTMLSYPRDGLPLEPGTRYVWQVQALDESGQPVGERQGKSEVWAFTYDPLVPVITTAAAPSSDPEPSVGRFSWSGIEVKVLSLTDSSRSNYTGVGRARIIPGLFEPSFEFRSVRLDSAGARVRFAPRHVVNIPDGMGVLDWALEDLPSTPFFLDLNKLVLVADSSGDQFVGVSGAASLFLGFGLADSLADAGPLDVDVGGQWTCTPPPTTPLEPLDPQGTACTPARDAYHAPDSTERAEMQRIYDEMKKRSLYFRFDTLGVGSSGPHGTLRLKRDFSTGMFGMPNASVTLFADSTTLVLNDGGGRLDMAGSFRFPSGVGLIKDVADTVWKDTTRKEVASLDSTITLRFRRVRLGSDGEVLISAEGIPRARIRQTGIRIQSGDTWIDLSGSLSPSGRAAGWRGVFFDSVRVFLPDAWHTAARDSASAVGDATILGRRLAVDGNGLDGEIVGSGLENLGPIGFAGFSGYVDSVRFVFASGNLDLGYVEGRMTVPFLLGEIPYWTEFTPTGVERAYARITEPQRYEMPAVGGDLLVQRGEFTYERPTGTFSMDARLSLKQGGVSMHEAQLYGLTISNDGGIKLRNGWIALDQANQAGFNGFPVDVDSIGFGSGATGDEVWLGVSGKFALNDNLPSAAGAFRVFAVRERPGADWRFSRLAVDRLDMRYRNAAVEFGGALEYIQNDSIYGKGFKAAERMAVQNQFSVDGTFIAGATSSSGGTPGFRYWYVDGRLVLPPPGIQLGPIPLAIWGFAGGAFSRMTATIDTVTLKATYVPSATTALGFIAGVSIGTSANSGYIWNADGLLKAEFGDGGSLRKMTLEADNWMLTEVARREERIWGKVLIDFPVSQPVLHANATLGVKLLPALEGNGWAELHFEPGRWYINAGTPQRPDSLRLLPASLDLPATAYFQLDPQRVNAGVGVYLDKSETKGNFRGRIEAGFEAGAEIRYRPFQATGEGELWGDIVAEVKAAGDWYEIMSGSARATMNFRMPDPMGIWGRIKLKYRLLHGTVKGTYKMNYKWGDTPDAGESDSAQFTVVGGTYPVMGDTGAPLTGMTWYLGMSEGTEYGMDDGVYRLRMSGAPQLLRRVVTTATDRDRTGRVTGRRNVISWVSLGTPVRDWLDDRSALLIKAPGSATLAPATMHRAIATFVLEKQDGTAWEPLNTVTSTVEFRTTGQAALLAHLVTATDPAGSASPMYYGGPDAGAVRVQFSNVHPDMTSGAVTGVLVANGRDTTSGSWGPSGYSRSSNPMLSNQTLYAFQPSGGMLAPSTSYRFAMVSTDTSRTEHRAVSFVTSRYATLLDHVGLATKTITSDRGVGPLTQSGAYLLGARIVLASPEPIAWTDIDSVEVTGLTGWVITPSTRCQWVGGANAMVVGAPISRLTLCGAEPVYENILDVAFVTETDAQLPPSSTAALTIRINHRREGWRSFTFALPSLSSTVAQQPQATVNVAAPPVMVDVTRPSAGRRP